MREEIHCGKCRRVGRVAVLVSDDGGEWSQPPSGWVYAGGPDQTLGWVCDACWRASTDPEPGTDGR